VLKRSEEYAQLGLRNTSVILDIMTVQQVDAIAGVWGDSRSEVIRTLLEWGMEQLDGQEKEAVEEIAARHDDGDM